MPTRLQLSDSMYIRFRDLLQRRAGLYYPEHRREDLAHGLSQVLAAGNYSDLEALYEDAVAGSGWNAVLEHLTIGETRFFRNEAHFAALRAHVFPELIARRASLRSLRLWSAGCASGEEPFSLAMLISDLLPAFQEWNVSILATDVNERFLERAREGLYSAWSFRETSEDLRSRFFTPEGARWRLNANIRRAATFMPLNLVESKFPSITNGTYGLDMIVCRNVTIYFGWETTRQIVERFYEALTPGGWLLVGHSEPQAAMYAQFETHNFPNAIFYRKPLDAPLFSVPGMPTPAPAKSRPDTTPLPASSPTRQEAASPPRVKGDAAARNDSAPARRPVTRPLPRQTEVSPPAREDPWLSVQARIEKAEKPRAEHLVSDFLNDHPQHTEAMVKLGRLHADRGDWEGAKQMCERALALDSLCARAAYLLAQIYEHEERLDDALTAYRRAIYADPNFAPGTLGMANIWRRMSRHEEARRSYRSLLRQLAMLPATATIPDTDGASAGELMQFAKRQLDALD